MIEVASFFVDLWASLMLTVIALSLIAGWEIRR